MTAKQVWTRALTALALAAAVYAPARGELAVQQSIDGKITTSLMAIVDHPDPIDQNAWRLFRPLDPSLVLNEDGFVRGDGTPDFTALPTSGWPLVVWALNAGSEFDIAFAEWSGEAWSEPFFVSETADNEMDPRVSLDIDGSVWVVWWVDRVGDGVYVSQRSAEESIWSVPMRVSEPGITARRPSLVVHEGTLLVAYEQDSAEPGMAQDIVVAERRSEGGFTYHLVAGTTRTERLDAILHSAHGQVWLDWKHDEGEFASAVAESSSWSLWNTVVWTDTTWIGVEETRRTIQNELFLP